MAVKNCGHHKDLICGCGIRRALAPDATKFISEVESFLLQKPVRAEAMILVDGVEYTATRIREIIHERHRLAEDNRRLRDVARRQQVHLQRRTAALVRLIAARPRGLDAAEGASPIARKGPRL